MTAWPGSKSLHVRDDALYTDLNTYVRDALDAEYNAPFVTVKRTATQSIPASTPTYVVWTDEVEDAYGFHAASSTDLVVPAGCAGLYVVSYCVEIAAGASAVEYSSFLVVNDDYAFTAEDASPGVGGDSAFSACTVWPLAVGDAVAVDVFQDHTAARNLLVSSDYSPRFQMCWVAP